MRGFFLVVAASILAGCGANGSSSETYGELSSFLVMADGGPPSDAGQSRSDGGLKKCPDVSVCDREERSRGCCFR